MSLETYGRYQLLKKLAMGGMAQIYLARQVGLEGFEKLLVVKRILPHLAENQDFISMFLDEARIAARLNHPNVVQIFDLGQQDDTYFIAMEYIHGEDVRKVFRQAERGATPVPLPLICRIIIEACAGLDYAHKRVDAGGRPLNIVHRDISPQNILVSFEGGVKIVDFGIAKAADQSTVTRSGVLKGKYSYMSPEQAAGKGVDSRTDTFALGVVMYELLTSTRLFKRPTDIQTLNAVGECKVPPPSEFANIPKELERIVMRTLSKDKEQRYVEARQLATDLENFLLSRKLHSSTSHLAAFMQQIYAERLAREAEEGRLLFIESTLEKAEEGERATPASDSASKPSRSQRSLSKPGPAPPPPRPEELGGEATTAERPQAISKSRLPLAPPAPRPPDNDEALTLPYTGTGPKPPRWTSESVSKPTESAAHGRGSRIALVVSIVGVLGVVVGGVGYYALKPARAKVLLKSEPTGARVRFEGRMLECHTPCALPTRDPGSYPVQLMKPGYGLLDTAVVIAESGDQQVLLKLVAEVVPDAGAPLVVEPKLPPPPVEVPVGVSSEPSGAPLFVDDVRRGVTPQTVTGKLGTTLTFRVEAEGYLTAIQQVRVSEHTAPILFVLTKKSGKRPDQPHPPPPPPPPVGTGTVRFIVNPWATVECPPYKLGETPFPDKQLPAGEYHCTFTNPELNQKQTRDVKVEVGTTTKVAVTFPAH